MACLVQMGWKYVKLIYIINLIILIYYQINTFLDFLSSPAHLICLIRKVSLEGINSQN